MPKLRGWNSYFDRFVTVLHGATAWSLCHDVSPPHHVFDRPLASVLELPTPLPDPVPRFAPLLAAHASSGGQSLLGQGARRQDAAAPPGELPRARARTTNAGLPPVDVGGALWRSLVGSDAFVGADADGRPVYLESIPADRAAGVQVWPAPSTAAPRDRIARAPVRPEKLSERLTRSPTPEGTDRQSVAYGIAH